MRVASIWTCCAMPPGALAGGLLATLPWTVRLSRAMQRLRRRWLLADNSADYALMLVALWFLTQINPANPLFGVVVMPEGLPQPFESPIADPALFCFCWKPAGAMLNLTATLLFIASFLARRRDYAPVLGGFFCWPVVQGGGNAAMLKPVAYFAWINPHVLAGLALGGVLTWLLCHTQRLVQSLCALLLLGLAQLAAAQWPLVAADDDQRGLFRWAYHLTNINALSEFANRLWRGRHWRACCCRSAASCAASAGKRGSRCPTSSQANRMAGQLANLAQAHIHISRLAHRASRGQPHRAHAQSPRGRQIDQESHQHTLFWPTAHGGQHAPVGARVGWDESPGGPRQSSRAAKGKMPRCRHTART